MRDATGARFPACLRVNHFDEAGVPGAGDADGRGERVRFELHEAVRGFVVENGGDAEAGATAEILLHGIDHTEHVPDLDRVAALRPAYWRLAKYQTYAFVAQLENVHVNYSVSDPYGWSVGYPNARPWEDWPGWESYVRGLVASRTAWFPEAPIASWDVWNEPDHPYFWSGTYGQLLELFAHGGSPFLGCGSRK